ncbi:MAG: hypothetical protein V7L21_12850 [Nostoc sp.]|uniref:hypothetical protein n=1 Tax=Nostoc sp. TaxID=1180 RepID=UPI002FFC1A9D
MFHRYLTNVPFDFAQGMFCLGKSITATAMPAAGVAIALLENFRGDRFQRLFLYSDPISFMKLFA